MGESIVVGTDGSARARKAVDEALRLARLLDAEVHVVSAYEPQRDVRISGAPEAAARVWQPTPDAHVDRVLQEAAAVARSSGVEVQVHAVREDPADAVLAVADDVGATLVVVGNQGMHGAKRVLGSVPNTVSHRASCNVLIVATDDVAG